MSLQVNSFEQPYDLVFSYMVWLRCFIWVHKWVYFECQSLKLENWSKCKNFVTIVLATHFVVRVSSSRLKVRFRYVLGWKGCTVKLRHVFRRITFHHHQQERGVKLKFNESKPFSRDWNIGQFRRKKILYTFIVVPLVQLFSFW